MMAEKTRKQRLEEMLADEPNDAFLRYGLAMEYASEGNDDEALRCLRRMFADKIDYVPAYQHAGQILMRLDRTDEAREAFQQGIALARRTGDAHAAGEMEGFLDTLG
jgi:tetratricopeptide (TPR) repeat protein